MRTAGIIAEYNPFHNGHAWQIAELKKRGFEAMVCVCSPGEVSPYWLLVLLSSGGEVVRTLYQSDTLQPDRINQLIAQLAGMRRFNCTARTVANLMSGEVTA